MVLCTGIYGHVKKITLPESTKVSNYLTNPTQYPLTTCQKIAADVDGDGVITQNDVNLIANYALHGISDQTTYPTGLTGQIFTNVGPTLCTGIYGDVTGIDIGDGQKVAMSLDYPTNPTYTLDDCQKIAADVDGDEAITQTDADYIANYVAYGTGDQTNHPTGRTGQVFTNIETCKSPTCSFTIV